MTTEECLAYAAAIEHRALGNLATARAFSTQRIYQPDFTMIPEPQLWAMPHPHAAADRKWFVAGCFVGGFGALAAVIMLSLVKP